MALADEALKTALDKLSRRCAEEGEQLTDLRRLLMEVLLKAGKPLKAYALAEEIALRGRRITPATVYRILDFLVGRGLVHKVNAINAYVACSERGAPPAHQPLLLVCPSCQKTTEINDPDLSSLLFSKLAGLGHSMEGGSVEVRGRCGFCAGK
jgi:Fur family zinc uptake transcriptional regulator